MILCVSLKTTLTFLSNKQTTSLQIRNYAESQLCHVCHQYICFATNRDIKGNQARIMDLISC